MFFFIKIILLFFFSIFPGLPLSEWTFLIFLLSFISFILNHPFCLFPQAPIFPELDENLKRLNNCQDTRQLDSPKFIQKRSTRWNFSFVLFRNWLILYLFTQNHFVKLCKIHKIHQTISAKKLFRKLIFQSGQEIFKLFLTNIIR